MGSAAHAVGRPARPATWLLGEGHGVQVWMVEVDSSISGSVLIGHDAPVVLLNSSVVGTTEEGATLVWALERVAMNENGFYVRRA